MPRGRCADSLRPCMSGSQRTCSGHRCSPEPEVKAPPAAHPSLQIGCKSLDCCGPNWSRFAAILSIFNGLPETTNLGVRSSNLFGRASNALQVHQFLCCVSSALVHPSSGQHLESTVEQRDIKRGAVQRVREPVSRNYADRGSSSPLPTPRWVRWFLPCAVAPEVWYQISSRFLLMLSLSQAVAGS